MASNLVIGVAALLVVSVIWRVIRYDEPFSGWARRKSGNETLCAFFAGGVSGAAMSYAIWDANSQLSMPLRLLVASAGAAFVGIFASWVLGRSDEVVLPWAQDEIKYAVMVTCIVGAASWTSLPAEWPVWWRVSGFFASVVVLPIAVVGFRGGAWPFWTAGGRSAARGWSPEPRHRARASMSSSSSRRWMGMASLWARGNCGSAAKPAGHGRWFVRLPVGLGLVGLGLLLVSYFPGRERLIISTAVVIAFVWMLSTNGPEGTSFELALYLLLGPILAAGSLYAAVFRGIALAPLTPPLTAAAGAAIAIVLSDALSAVAGYRFARRSMAQIFCRACGRVMRSTSRYAGYTDTSVGYGQALRTRSWEDVWVCAKCG